MYLHYLSVLHIRYNLWLGCIYFYLLSGRPQSTKHSFFHHLRRIRPSCNIFIVIHYMLPRQIITKKLGSSFLSNTALGRRVATSVLSRHQRRIHFDRRFALYHWPRAKGPRYFTLLSTTSILKSSLRTLPTMPISSASGTLSEFLQAQKTQYLKAVEEGKGKEWTVVTGNEAGGTYRGRILYMSVITNTK